MSKSHILGFPRIGKNRELKKAVEEYWNGEISQKQLQADGEQIRKINWQIQHDAGLDFVTVGDFSWYDHVLDTSAMLGVLPERFALCDPNKDDNDHANIDLDTIFCMARGKAPNKNETSACAMKKWFNTNYHYIVPELKSDQTFHLSTDTLFKEIDQAHAIGYKQVKPVLLGPLTFLWLSKCHNAQGDYNKLDLLDRLIPVYNQILDQFRSRKISWFQFDEPILVLDLPNEWQHAFVNTYQQLKLNQLNCLLTTYFGSVISNLDVIVKLPVQGLHIDICSAPEQLSGVATRWDKNKILSLGIINGRNVWRNDFKRSLNLINPIQKIWEEKCWLGSSCSLLHSPVDLDNEPGLDAEIKSWLSFAKQKVKEISTLTNIVKIGIDTFENEISENIQHIQARHQSKRIDDKIVKERIRTLNSTSARRNKPYSERAALQQNALKLPVAPTTTIGSFPQTEATRKIRHAYKTKSIDQLTYNKLIKEQINNVIRLQEDIGLDVLVHGEFERNDMVEYFAELLNGFIFTSNGWVQSYGSRCVKPPIIYGDVSRKGPMTVEWITYAQSLTTLPVKGMLTGPITVMSWSFVRDDQPIAETALQIALAIADEVKDLENAGIRIIQIDEPAFREALPLQKKDWASYFNWAIFSFHIASCDVKDETQIHTHMCYSEFNDIMTAIAALDADVITIENSRSAMELLNSFSTFSYPNEIGPGIYDIHSPNIPTTTDIINSLEKALDYIPLQRLWVNPDCGLKTRQFAEVISSLSNMIKAAKVIRTKYNEVSANDNLK